MSETTARAVTAPKPRRDLARAVVRFAGDSGDGMQLTGEQFTLESAVAGSDLATLPNFRRRSARRRGRCSACRASSCSSAANGCTPGDRSTAWWR